MTFAYRTAAAFSSLDSFLTDGTNGLFHVLTEMGWTALDNNDGVGAYTYDRVFKSTGEDGTEVIYIRITRTTASPAQWAVRHFSYYDDTQATFENKFRNLSAGTSTITANIATQDTVLAWIYGDLDSFAVVFRQTSTYSCFCAGVIKRIQPPNWSGRTKTSGGGTQTLLMSATGHTHLVVGNTTNMAAGQPLFIIDQTDGANSGNIAKCTINSVDSGSALTVTSADSANDVVFDNGSLVGFDPMPVTVMGVATYGLRLGSGGFFLYDTAMTTRLSGAAQALGSYYSVPFHMLLASFWTTYSGVNNFSVGTLLASSAGSTMYPDGLGFYQLTPYIVTAGKTWNASWSTWTTTALRVRGWMDRLAVYSATNIASEDIINEGNDTWLATPSGTTDTLSNCIVIRSNR